MKKKLTEMSLGELWQLFPIELRESRSEWWNDYQEIADKLNSWLPEEAVVRIAHIGSTAIKGIKAKNIVDVLVEFTSETNLESMAQILESNGCIIMSVSETRISLNRGYTPEGFAEKVYHIHLRFAGDNDELYFRDYLNQFPELAKEYEALKEKLAIDFKYDRDQYTLQKSSFVEEMTKKAKALYGVRY
ncbi:GrpB family protein [Enterococcus sp. 669A]|uniref:GrpB family protein n=1 Tax=Candidatus Enterococcus moelleringii TaxID=2815325 RepID=A0ABS3LC98_9ENTE|nr:GrpB family protein [Enterococcus sp. 669A]MBO1307257.1 GrpB family protein [Enterococcus sp. 669A]